MSMQDPISDMFTRIRNAQAVNKKQVFMPASRSRTAIAAVLKDEGYITDFSREEHDGKPSLVITLKYHDGAPVIEELRRVSRPGLRVYKGKDELPKFKSGLGVALISTSQGLMSDRQARKLGQGGEVIGYVS